MDKKDYGYIIKTDRWRSNLNEERKECRADYAGLRYVNLCDRLGFEPEDEILYEHGLAERMLKENRRKFF